MIRRTLGQWPARRWIAVIALTPLLALTFFTLTGTSLGDPSFGWFTLTTLAAILSAGVLGSYVPREGLRPELGCAPCAVMPVATVAGAMIAMNTYGAAVIGPALATAITLYGLTQRISGGNSCDVPAEPPTGEPVRGSGRLSGGPARVQP